MTTSWRAGAVAAAMLASGCSIDGLFAIFGGRHTSALEGIAETLGGKWYGCGFGGAYLDLLVDGAGAVSGQAVVDGQPVLTVTGQVSEVLEEKGVVREATASLEFAALNARPGARLRFDQVGAAGSMLRGIKGNDGVPVLLLREPDPAIHSCPGLQSLAVPSPRPEAGLNGEISGSVEFGTPAPAVSPTAGPASPVPTASATPTSRPSPTATPVTTVVGGFQPGG